MIDEYTALLGAVDALEQTLASLAATTPRVWRRHVLRGYTALSSALRAHCEFAERPGGTLVDVEISIGRLYQLTVARREHAQLIAQVTDLIAAFGRAGEGTELPASVPDGAAQLVAAVRGHCRSEVDLIQLRYILDVGVVD